ncbi:PTS sugar transporter subunit IIA [Lacticaseibacillus paracasei]|uniref:PTS sugar transporter subunit IIA n=1 Tax=Lacticaseibacillus paracasei TaxID=1597 RepID=UPI0006ACF52E|nr:hypothetical protein [Lacticaseibacillus paracasei]
MRNYIIVSHRSFATGLKSSLDFFSNMKDQIVAVPAYTNGENSFPEEMVANLVRKFEATGNQIVILTDMLGGSVNQHVMKYMNQGILVVTGVNLPLALALVLSPGQVLTSDKVETLIDEAKSQMVLMNTYQDDSLSDDE